jgi:phosphoglycolate phosphatase-like HAD superfamily hydrolase
MPSSPPKTCTAASPTQKSSWSPPAKLNVPPSHCIVVEDALHGIEAARAASMKSIGVTRN